MSEMNFIPSSMVQRQRNQQLLNKGGRAIVLGITSLLAVYMGISAYNQHLIGQIEHLIETKNHVNQMLVQLDIEKKSLTESQQVAASLNNLNSFNALNAVLKTLNNTIPEETELSVFQTEFDENGDSLTAVEGVSDSHKNLTNWVTALKKEDGVRSADLITSESIQANSIDELRQRFELLITRSAMEDPSS